MCLKSYLNGLCQQDLLNIYPTALLWKQKYLFPFGKLQTFYWLCCHTYTKFISLIYKLLILSIFYGSEWMNWLYSVNDCCFQHHRHFEISFFGKPQPHIPKHWVSWGHSCDLVCKHPWHCDVPSWKKNTFAFTVYRIKWVKKMEQYRRTEKGKIYREQLWNNGWIQT